MPEFILDVQGLETTFKTPDGTVHAVNGVSFGLAEGETLGVVGESGAGAYASDIAREYGDGECGGECGGRSE